MIEVDWMRRLAQIKPQNLAVTDGETAESLTYTQLYKWSQGLALHLDQTLKIKKGDRVACLATNSIEYIALFFALQRTGAILVPINHRLTVREIEYIVANSEAEHIFYDLDFDSTIKELQKNLKLTASPLTGAQGVRQFWNQKTENTYTQFKGDFADPVMIMYTSGTTGFPKGAVLTHEMLFWNSTNTALSLDLTEKDCAVIFMPFFHTGGWNVLSTPFLHRGAHIVLLKKFDAGQVLELSVRYRSTILFAVPTTMQMMAQTHHFNELDMSWIRYAIVGGEPMPVPLIEKWHQKNIPVRQGYGLTEFGPNVFSLHQKDAVRKQGSIGFPNFYVSTKVVDNNGKELGPHQIGELALSGPMCMKEYWKNSTATKETIIDGWLHTGDLVKYDEDGFFYVVGRKKEMFISGGENVYPVEVEQVMAKYPGIREVAVIGVPDSKWGEVGCAFVVSEKPLEADKILDYAKQNLAKFKIPKTIKFLDALPKGDSGKILKKNLKDLAASVN